ncbi:polyphenol oxidase family protein, partial [Candidatus Gottesmanbacteria bacterium]|nr:polyphenol oxidase family protein [Candidatus Gottesmanbacteria bacterium]
MANKINFYQNFFPDWVVAGTTRKSFGNIKDPLNQVKLAEILKVPTSSLVSLTQKHTNFIYDASEASSQKIGDGLITDKKEIVIFVKTADCIPVLILEEKKKLIMVLHAGRVGLQKQIGEHGIKEILKRGGKVVNIKVLLGPFIEEKCYDFDLATLVKVQLHKNGVEDRQIVST